MNVFITGTSRGIGYELMQWCIKNDSIKKVFVSSTKEIDHESNKVVLVNIDFLTSEWRNDLINIVGGEEINILINNAGYLNHEKFVTSDISEVKKIFEVNYFGPYQLIQSLYPNLKKGKAHIVNIGSMGGFQGSSKFPGLAAYSSSKAAIANLTECLAEEFKEEDVSCNCLALGAVNTEMLAQAFPGYKAPVNPKELSDYIMNFALSSKGVLNGKVIPLSITTP